MTDYDVVANELSTIRDFLRWTTSRFNEAGLFYGHGNADAFNEASQLILGALKLSVTELPELFIDATLSSLEKNHLISLIQKRVEQQIPVPYLINEAWFCNLPFYVDERVLIPRSPFAELIQDRFEPWLPPSNTPTRVLDMCTGSACIAIALAYTFEEALIDAVDISADALEVGKVNIEKHHLTETVKLIESNVWKTIPDSSQYDLIVSNPPYVGSSEMETLPNEYRHEPKLALEAEQNGLAIVEQILVGAADHLTDEGLLFVEVGNSDLAVEERWPEIAFTWLEMENGGHGIFMLDKPTCQFFKENC